MNAPRLFEEMVKGRIAPALRDLGMRGSGQNFRLPNEDGDYALLGFQKDSWDGTMRFTANVAFHSARGWQDARDRHGWLPAQPTASSMYAVEPDLQGWSERIGHLMDPPHDHWWTIPTESDVPVVADHVIAVVRGTVLPQLRTRLAGIEPPPQPTKEIGPVADCPAPTCAYPPVAWVDGAELDSLSGVLAADEGDDPDLDAVQRELVDRARNVAVPRARAWKVLHISRARLDEYADRIGAGAALTFAQLLAVNLLGTDDLLAPARWPDVTALVTAWAAQLPDANPDATLVVGEDAVALMPLTAALTRDDHGFGSSVVQPLMPATLYLLEELSSANAV
ncbi:hypothetical protein DQ244_02705 [Blastococcus sp. TBT05-19]|uniref:DUF4304 domain-containing protein n=1 Tax=Blastococcus sp. TBT05-19 TaxID=2250581 RepID=UPI000DE8F490|nr:DUF4304 domain-containing protein [Blastococcus sp. TBT05-19]RBY94265.1 hypothetical protein DQ244_02705 [Blastococcus sp. TBT05-19]